MPGGGGGGCLEPSGGLGFRGLGFRVWGFRFFLSDLFCSPFVYTRRLSPRYCLDYAGATYGTGPEKPISFRGLELH